MSAKSVRGMALSLVIAGLVAGPCQAASAGQQPAAYGLSQSDLVKEILKANNVIQSKRMAEDIAQAGVEGAKSIFQPVASVSLGSTRLKEANTPEDELLRSGLGIYDLQNQDAEAGVGMLTSTGAKVEIKSTLSRLNTNVSNQRRGYSDNDFKSYYGVSVTQPLARDAGETATKSAIRVAELDATAAREVSLETAVSVSAEALATYYDLAAAQARVSVWQEGVTMANDLLVQAKNLHASGRLSEADIWDVESSLTRYQAGLNEAQQSVTEQSNKLQSFLLVNSSAGKGEVRAVDPLPAVVVPDFTAEESYKLALEHRPDYRMRQAMIQREGVQIAYAKNQALPKVDLVASYGINGLELDPGNAMGNIGPNYHDFPAWSLALKASMPLGEDQKARAELRAAKLRKQDALLSLKALETSLLNDIDTSLNAVRNAHARWEMYRHIEEVEKKQVQRERERLAAGRSDMREVLTREELRINSRTAVLDQAAAFAKAKLSLELAQGTLIDTFGAR